ncbi:MAG TPA: radical SAM protein [Longimicrobium sp.]|nr:radical SAM protein [Longimicrobium sp.]
MSVHPRKILPVLGSEHLPRTLGRVSVSVSDRVSIIGPATGYMSDYDITLNPYVGCGFGCSYCYAASFVPPRFRQLEWGTWVEVKRQAAEQLRTEHVTGKRIYLGSVTDPYQPLESRTRLVRSMLAAMSLPGRQPRLVIQTRSPLAVRDIDLFRRFDRIRVNMSVTTDSDEVRKRYEPTCPSIDRRIDAIREIGEAGVPIGICITPMLPLNDPIAFGERLAQLGAAVYVAQPFKPAAQVAGAMKAGTRDAATELASREGWNMAAYRSAFQTLASVLPHLHEGRAGFMPA